MLFSPPSLSTCTEEYRRSLRHRRTIVFGFSVCGVVYLKTVGSSVRSPAAVAGSVFIGCMGCSSIQLMGFSKSADGCDVHDYSPVPRIPLWVDTSRNNN